MRLRLYNNDKLIAEQVGDKLVKRTEGYDYPPALFGISREEVSIDTFMRKWITNNKMIPEGRSDLNYILNKYGIKENTPLEWIHKTNCRTLEDSFWVEDMDYGH